MRNALTPTSSIDGDLIRRMLTDAGLSQRGAARMLEISERTMRHYCAGDYPVPHSVTLALKHIAQMQRDAEILAALNPEMIQIAERKHREMLHVLQCQQGQSTAGRLARLRLLHEPAHHAKAGRGGSPRTIAAHGAIGVFSLRRMPQRGLQL